MNEVQDYDMLTTRELLYKEITKEDDKNITSFGEILKIFTQALTENGNDWVQINYTPSIITISTIGVNRVFRKLR